MSNYSASANAMKLRILKFCGERVDGTSTYDTDGTVIDYMNRAAVDLLAGSNEFQEDVGEPWSWALQNDPLILALQPGYNTGTISVTNGSAQATISPIPSVDLTGYLVKVGSDAEWYRITKAGYSNVAGTYDSSYIANVLATVPTGQLSSQVNAVVILSDGSVVIVGQFATGAGGPYIAKFASDGTFNTSFNSALGSGFNGFPTAMAVDASGRILVGGGFTSYNTAARNYIIRLNSDGSEDLVFSSNNGSGFDDGNSPAINSIAVQSDGKIVIGGVFTSFNGVAVNGILRLNSDGTLDNSFNFNLGTGASPVRAVAVQSGGGIIVSGSFTTFNGNSRRSMVRLNADGTEDVSFYANLGTAFNAFVGSLAIQSDGKIIAGGSFTTFNGLSRGRIIRLNSSGTEDTSFYGNLGTGFNAVVGAVAVQPDGKIMVGGTFTLLGSGTRNRLVRLNSTGVEDFAFYMNAGAAFGAAVSCIASSLTADYVGGSFTTFNNITEKYFLKFSQVSSSTDFQNSGAITLDAAYVGVTNNASSFDAELLDYSISSQTQNILRLVSPFTVYAYQDMQGDNEFKIYSLDRFVMERDFPLRMMQPGTPTFFCTKSRTIDTSTAGGSVFKVRFNKAATQPTRVEVNFISYPDIMVDSTSSFSPFPIEFLDAVCYAAAYWLLTDKSDDRAQTYLGLAKAKISSMRAAEERQRANLSKTRFKLMPRGDNYWRGRKYVTQETS